MIRTKNIVAQGGYKYNKYLKKQLAEVMDNAYTHKQYNMADMKTGEAIQLEDGRIVPVHNLQRYTRVTGALFDRWNLTKENYLTDDKIDLICALELGEDARTAGQIKPVLRNYKTIMGADGYPVEVDKKDIGRAYYLDQYGDKIKFDRKDVKTKSGYKKKTAIELVFSMDPSFSHASALMNDDDKVKAAKLWLDCAETSYKECFDNYLETYHGAKGETGASLYFHNDNRKGDSFDHVHLNISNLIRLDDGKIMSIEMPAMRQKNFHQAMDAMAKNMFVTKWQEQFGEKYPVEAYDKNKQSLSATEKFQTSEIDNHRVAFTDDILETIRQRSKSKELIEKVISQQKRDEYERAELKRMSIQEQIDGLDKKIKGMELPTNYGTILSHGAAPYKDDPKESNSYFVELTLSNGKSKKIWSKDLEKAISEKRLNIGDYAGFSQTGEKSIKVKDSNGQWIDAVRKTWEGFDLSKNRDEMSTLSDLDGRIKAINKAHESSIKVIESSKNRDAIWMSIKEKKKAIGKELKDVELNKEAVQLGSTIKSKNERGVVFIIKDDETLLDKLTNTNPFFTKYDLIIELSKTESMGSKASQLADEKLKHWFDTGLLLSKKHKEIEELSGKKSTFFKSKDSKSKQSAKKKEPEHPIQFTTKKLALQELQNVKIGKKIISNKGFKGVDDYRNAVSQVIKSQDKNRRFNTLQIDLMKAVIEPKGTRMVLCEGFPGTGKSTVMGGAIEIMQKQAGTHCLVLAPTGKVAASAGVDTTANHTGTIDAWLIGMDSGKTSITNNTCIFIDEAGMIGTKNYNKFLNHVDKAIEKGIDVKVVLIGDTNQIQSVSSGNTYSEIIKDNKNDIHYLRKIIRQKDAISLDIAKTTSLSEIAADKMTAVKKSGSHVQKSWKMIEDSGRLLEFDTTTEKNESIADRYIADSNRVVEKVILCATNEDVKTLNELIQDKRLASGKIGGMSITNNDESFYVGDRVMVNKNSTEYKNGDFGIINKIHANGSFDIEFGEGKDSNIKTMKDTSKIALAAAISIHKSQGLTVNSVILNGTATPVVDQELWNVAQTRARYTTFTAVVKSEKAKVLESFMRENSKISLYELGLEVEAKAEAARRAQAPTHVEPQNFAPLDKTHETTNTAIAAMYAKASVPITTTASETVAPGRPNLMAQLRTKFRSFGKISTSVFSPRKPPVAIIKQRQAQEALKQSQAAQQVKATQQVAVKQETAKQAQIAQQTALKKRKSLGLNM